MSKTNSIAETVVDSFNDVGTAVSNDQCKSAKPLPWWFLGPMGLAFVMFLLIGTIFERRIKAFWHRTVSRRQALTSQGTDYVEPQADPISDSPHTFKIPSDKALVINGDIIKTEGNTNSDTSIANDINSVIRIEKSLHCEGETFTSNSSNGIY